MVESRDIPGSHGEVGRVRGQKGSMFDMTYDGLVGHFGRYSGQTAVASQRGTGRARQISTDTCVRNLSPRFSRIARRWWTSSPR